MFSRFWTEVEMSTTLVVSLLDSTGLGDYFSSCAPDDKQCLWSRWPHLLNLDGVERHRKWSSRSRLLRRDNKSREGTSGHVLHIRKTSGCALLELCCPSQSSDLGVAKRFLAGPRFTKGRLRCGRGTSVDTRTSSHRDRDFLLELTLCTIRVV
jgi:hypothetical protein